MEYTYKINVFHPSIRLQLIDGVLKQFDNDGTEVRSVRIEEVKGIRQFAGPFASSDPDTGPFATEYCVLETAKGKPLSFRNGYFLGRGDGTKWSEKVTNQTNEYATFLRAIKQSVVAVHPTVRVRYGGWFASVAWMCNGLLGLGLSVMGVAIFLTDKLSTALIPGLFCISMGGLLLWSSIRLTKVYWPKCITVEQDLRSAEN